jgi:hypothetical protein
MPTDTNSQRMSVTLEQIAQAFTAWENGFRAEPSKYLTAEECAAANVSTLSADRAAYFRELLALAPQRPAPPASTVRRKCDNGA